MSWLRNTVPAANRLFSSKPQLFADSTQERLRKLDEKTATVAGLAVGRDSTAMRQARKRLDRGFDDPVTRQIIEIRNQSETATVLVQGRVQQCFR